MAVIPFPASVMISRIEWSLDRPANVNVSPYTGFRHVGSSPWHGKWGATVELSPMGIEDNRDWRAFLFSLRGQLNSFRLPASAERAQNSNSGVVLAAAAAQGATNIFVTGAATPLVPGQFITIANQLLGVTFVYGETLWVEPPLRAAAFAGTPVETSRPFAMVSMRESVVGWTVGPGAIYGAGFEVDEVNGVDELADYALALHFPTRRYFASGTRRTLLSDMPGYSFARTGEQGAVEIGGAAAFFAANVPAINGMGYHSHTQRTNNVLNSRDLTLDSWTKRGTATVTTDGTTRADGTGLASRVTVGLIGTNDVFDTTTGGLNPSFMIRPISTSGTLRIQNPQNGPDFWDVNLALLPGGWNRIAPGHPAIIGGSRANLPWSIGGGLQFGNPVAGNISFHIDCAQSLDGFYLPDGGPIVTTTTAAASVGASALSMADVAVEDNQIFLVRAVKTVEAAINTRLAYWGNDAANDLQRIDILNVDSRVDALVTVGGVQVYAPLGPTFAAGTVITAVLRRLGFAWRFGVIHSGTLTWAGGDVPGAFPLITTASVGMYRPTLSHQNSNPVLAIARKVGIFDSDASILAAAAEMV